MFLNFFGCINIFYLSATFLYSLEKFVFITTKKEQKSLVFSEKENTNLIYFYLIISFQEIDINIVVKK